MSDEMAEFYRARLDESEVRALWMIQHTSHVTRLDELNRDLRDIESKRQILTGYERIQKSWVAYPNPGNAGAFMVAQTMVKILLQPFSEHPDYKESWRL